MTQRPDGTYDGSGWFTDKSAESSYYASAYNKWGRQINARRAAIDKDAHQLPLELFRPHSGRHGCVLNLKRAGVDPDQGCIHVCMTRHFWDTVYGLEDAVRVGEEVTGLVVGSATHAGDHSKLPCRCSRP